MDGGIPVFDGERYEIWSKKMKTLFLSLELWDLVQQGYEYEGYGLTRLAEFRKKDSKALYLIQQGVSNNIFSIIMEAESSKEAWDAIGLKFDQIYFQKEQIEIDITKKKRGQTTTTLTKDQTLPKVTETREKCFFKVPHELRKGNEEFYEPKVLAIGPYFRGRANLDSMELVKSCYKQQLLDLTGEQNDDRYIQAVMPHLERVKKCYELSNYKDDELAQMLVDDGCFIIELFRIHQKVNGGEPIIGPDFIALQTDMLLIENQIPFFILQILFNMIHPDHYSDHHSHRSLILITLDFFDKRIMKYYYGKSSTQIAQLISKENVYHLLHITHKFIGLGFSQDISMLENQINLYMNLDTELGEATQQHLLFITNKKFGGFNFSACTPRSETPINHFMNPATKLENANVRLKRSLNTRSIFDITFIRGELAIPRWNIDNQSEIELRNLIAFEVCQAVPNERFFIDYAFFMDHLIDSSDDVNLLISRGILNNQMIDAKSVDTMLTKLTKKVNSSNPYIYYEITKDLREYCEIS